MDLLPISTLDLRPITILKHKRILYDSYREFFLGKARQNSRGSIKAGKTQEEQQALAFICLWRRAMVLINQLAMAVWLELPVSKQRGHGLSY